MKETAAKNTLYTPSLKYGKDSIWRWLIKDRAFYIMLIPGIVYYLVFQYLPIWGILVAFQDYQPFLGFWGSKWVGLKHFIRFFTEPTFMMLLKNTFVLAGLNLVFFFPAPIILALLLNEIRNIYFKKLVQTFTYVPHFMSWPVVVGLTYVFLTTEGGIVNEMIAAMGGEKISFLLDPKFFRPLIVLQGIWKDTGWGTIIFLAALTAVDLQLYEAARIDGANRLHQLWYITLPAISSTIIIMLILRLGHFLDTGFNQIFNMLNSMNRPIGEVFDTYVYSSGIQRGMFSYSTAVGLFKSLVALTLVLLSNKLAKKYGETSIF